MTEEPK